MCWSPAITDYLGKADTGITSKPPTGTMNTGEQLQANLSEAMVSVIGHWRF
jgi:hypothetical protein